MGCVVVHLEGEETRHVREGDPIGTVAEKVYRNIRKMLMDAELLPGQRVSQLRLARQLGCSPPPVIEALRRLESEGLLVKEPRKMARVRKRSELEIRGLWLVREGLEMISARQCAIHINDAQIAELQQLGKRFETAAKSNDDQTCEQLELAVHKFIAQCAKCPPLEEELARLCLIERTALTPTKRIKPDGYVTSHRAIIQAIADHDEHSAEYLMRRHIQEGATGHLRAVPSGD